MRRIVTLVALTLLAACGGGGSSTPHVAPALDAIADPSGRELVRLTFTVSATGTAPVTLAASGLPAGATFDPATGVFDWTPPEGALGVHDVTFTATNDAGSDSKVVHITVGRRAPYDAVAGVPGPVGTLQYISTSDPDGDTAFPTAASTWDLDPDFTLSDGGDDQWDGALLLYVGPAGTTSDPAFPSDQAYGDVTFSGPVATYAQGLKAVAVAGAPWASRGSYTALLSGTALTTLSQRLDLTGAVAPIALSVEADVETGGDAIQSGAEFFHMVLRGASGDLLATLDDGSDRTFPKSYDLSAYAGQAVTLSFEYSASMSAYTWVDNISAKDANHAEFVHNGDFETGDLTGWTPGASQSATVTSGVRALSGLNVTRSVYTPPGALWARWVDVFENPTDTAVSSFATYDSNLGSDGRGFLFLSADGRSISEFDGSDNSDRDAGVVFGGTAACTPTLKWATATTFGTAVPGANDIYETFPITVPAHGKVALVHFLIQPGVDTRRLAGTTVSSHPVEVETTAAAILAGWGVDPIYQDYLSADVRAAILNF